MQNLQSFPRWLEDLKPQPMSWGGLTVWSAEIPVARLRPNTGQLPGIPRNPRTWSREQLGLLAQSLEDTPELFAARGCLCAMADDYAVVIGGNMRLAAAREVGLQTVPCIVYVKDTDAAVLRSVAIKDNGSFGDWDFESLMAEWPEFDFAACGIDVPEDTDTELDTAEASEDGYTEAEADTAPARTKPGDLMQLGEHRLYCGDSTKPDDVKTLMGGAFTGLLLTDPPYNVDYEGGTSDKLKIQNDHMDTGTFKTFLTDAFRAADGVMPAGAAFYIWHASRFAREVEDAANAVGWPVRQQLIWNKNTFCLSRQDYQWKHEPCFYGWKSGAAHYFSDSRSESTVVEDVKPENFKAMKKDELVSLLESIYAEKRSTTVLNENKPSVSAEHPTMKPVKLMARLIRNSTRKGDAVLDSFAGSGSTLIACEQIGRRCYALELDPHYCDVIIDRWEKMTGRRAEKIN